MRCKWQRRRKIYAESEATSDSKVARPEKSCTTTMNDGLISKRYAKALPELAAAHGVRLPSEGSVAA